MDRQEVSKQLEQKMNRRPSRDDLVSHGVISTAETNVDGSLLPKMEELERKIISDKVNNNISRRNSKDLLNKQGIYKTMIEDKQQQLEKAKNAQVIDQSLKHRNENKELLNKVCPVNIDEVAPSIASKVIDLEKAKRRDSLKQMVQKSKSKTSSSESDKNEQVYVE